MARREDPRTPEAPQPISPDAQPVELWEAELLEFVKETYGPHAPVWIFCGARRKHGWAQSEPLTKEQFLQGLKATAEHSPEQR